LDNTPNWIVGLTELHKKIHKSYSNCVHVYLCFLLVVEVIKLNRISIC
jgi:hypothetical protein